MLSLSLPFDRCKSYVDIAELNQGNVMTLSNYTAKESIHLARASYCQPLVT
jgi:hypothetical protein